jgi:hypothetical protein
MDHSILNGLPPPEVLQTTFLAKAVGNITPENTISALIGFGIGDNKCPLDIWYIDETKNIVNEVNGIK